MKLLRMTIQMKAIGQYFQMMLFDLQYFTKCSLGFFHFELWSPSEGGNMRPLLKINKTISEVSNWKI